MIDGRILEDYHDLESQISNCDIKKILRSKNSHVNSLATLASVVDFQFRREITVDHIPKPSIHKPDEEVVRLDSSSG